MHQERRRSGRRSIALRLDTLLRARWYLYAGQVLFLMFAMAGAARLTYSLIWPFAAVGLGVGVAVVLHVMRRPSWQLSSFEGRWQLSFDALQISLFLAFLGGMYSPLVSLYIAPVVLASMVMERRDAVIVLFVGIVTSLGLALWTHFSALYAGPDLIHNDAFYIWAALAFVMFLAWNFSFHVANEARIRRDAMSAMQTALADEQRLAALGALSTAAAHELGTPLGTITLAAREVMNDMAEDNPYREEMAVIAQEALRCREILKGLSSTHADEREDLLRRLPIEALVKMAIEKHEISDRKIELKLSAPDGEGQEQPMVSNRPEIVHGIGNFIENAVGFSREKVEVLVSWDDEELRVSVLDDGPGFDASVVDRLGEPYISTRADADSLAQEGGDDTNAGGLGLGVFIAKTLIERTGGEVLFHNGLMGGAQIDMIWQRAIFDNIGEKMAEDDEEPGGFPEALQS